MFAIRISEVSKFQDLNMFHILRYQGEFKIGSCYVGNEAVAEVLAIIESFWENVDENTDLVIQFSYDSRVS